MNTGSFISLCVYFQMKHLPCVCSNLFLPPRVCGLCVSQTETSVNGFRLPKELAWNILTEAFPENVPKQPTSSSWNSICQKHHERVNGLAKLYVGTLLSWNGEVVYIVPTVILLIMNYRTRERGIRHEIRCKLRRM